jgi:hypothetical protein
MRASNDNPTASRRLVSASLNGPPNRNLRMVDLNAAGQGQEITSVDHRHDQQFLQVEFRRERWFALVKVDARDLKASLWNSRGIDVGTRHDQEHPISSDAGAR